MNRKPNEDLRQLFEAAKKSQTKTAAYEVADRTAATISWMQGYLRVVHETVEAGDLQTFADPKKELLFAKNELVRLSDLLTAINRWLAEQ